MNPEILKQAEALATSMLGRPFAKTVDMIAKALEEAVELGRSEKADCISQLEQINANLMGDDENAPRFTKKRLRAEIDRANLDATLRIGQLETALHQAAEGFDDIFCVPRVTETKGTDEQFDIIISMAGKLGTAARAALEGLGDTTPQQIDPRILADPCVQKLQPDEPFFVLLGRDPDAKEALNKWIGSRERREGQTDKVIAAEMTLSDFIVYQNQPAMTKHKFPSSQAAHDVLAERFRQVSEEGWSAEHDDKHHLGEMAGAAAAYALKDIAGGWFQQQIRTIWPWSQDWFKPTTQRRNLVKAAALLIAEIERIDRATPTPEAGQ